MGYGLGALGGSAGLVGGKGLGAFASSVGTVTGLGGQAAATAAPTSNAALAAGMEANAVKQAATSAAAKPGFLAQAGQFIKNNPLTSGALGLGAIGAMGGFDEDEEETKLPPMPTAGSQGSLRCQHSRCNLL